MNTINKENLFDDLAKIEMEILAWESISQQDNIKSNSGAIQRVRNKLNELNDIKGNYINALLNAP